jgi:hypothetical protein
MPKAIAHPRDDAAASARRQAREAAEAAFGQHRLASEEAPPVVVVKRRRSIGDAIAGHSGFERSGPEGQAREARVVRVESLLALQDDKAEPPQAEAPAPASPPRRSRRRAPHGAVTIIRPAPPVASDGAETLQRPSGKNDMVDRDAITRYEAVMAEIESLKRHADVLRKAEARRAVRWIRKAMFDYGLTAQDLGL